MQAPPKLSPFLPVISNTSLDAVAIQNKDIPCQTRKQRNKKSRQIT